MNHLPLGQVGLGNLRVQIDINLAANRRSERGDQTVIIAGRNRVEFVIVATCATNGHPKHRRAHRANHVVEFIVACGFEFFLCQLSWKHTGPKKTSCHQRQRILRRNLVACNLPAYKLIVRHIIIERLDDKIAIVIGMVPVGVLLKPKTVSITRKIQPMAPPTLTVMWRIQQLVHHALECCTRISISCGQEICDLLRCWRQADDVKVESTQQSTVLCRVVGLEPGSLELR